MKKIKGPAALLSTLPTFFTGKTRSLGALDPLLLLPLPLHPAVRRAAAFSSFPSSSSSTNTTASKATLLASAAATSAATHQGPAVTTTRSRSTPETARGRHVFEIAGYSLSKGIGVGKFVRSGKFAVGGYDWCIHYYPGGDGRGGSVGVFVALLTRGVEVRALFDIRLVNLVTGGLSPSIGTGKPSVFDDVGWSWGYQNFQNREFLEASEYLRDDSLVIQCDVTVIMEPSTDMQATSCYDIQVPPSKHLDGLQDLFGRVKTPNTKISVKGEVFHAHRSVLEARSPALIALEVGDEQETTIINYIEPDVFKVLLHFVYTDSLPPMDYAASIFSLDRLRLICESILCKNLSVNNVAAILNLANWHHCKQLKDACIRYITSSDRLDDVMASQGYKDLKVACPTLVAEISSKASKSCKIR
ncbi:hypothetical protein HU200_061161 [Digitaria exilis]|uniref:Uncharacterized protein n=1 Tax=Digitaria exilis TaxID=1010633 RepID=A0A835A522_9POAL|nr:hypothetical protein HU200_061161 [Digitaria exilis]